MGLNRKKKMERKVFYIEILSFIEFSLIKIPLTLLDVFLVFRITLNILKSMEIYFI